MGDDIVLIACSEEEQRYQLKIMEEFGLATGLNMNLKKSFHISSHDKELPIPACPENGFKYLGFMVNKNGIMWQMKEHILSRVKDGMEQWKYVTNRMLGKASILNSYIMSRLWYYSFILNFDNSIDNLEKLQRNFLRCGEFKNEKYITRPKMRMERLQVPIKFGGLGLFDLKTRFIAQKAWIIELALDPKSKIGTIWKEKYNLSANPFHVLNDPPQYLDEFWKAYRQSHNVKSSSKIDSIVVDNNWKTDVSDPIYDGIVNKSTPIIFSSYSYNQDTTQKPNKEEPDFIPLEKPKETKSRKVNRRKAERRKSKLKKITKRMTGPSKEILTPRQNKWKQERNTSLIHCFNKVRKLIDNVKIINTIWHYVNGMCYYDRQSPCTRCDESNSHAHIFFECKDMSKNIEPSVRAFSHNRLFKWEEKYCWHRISDSQDEVETSLIIAGMCCAWECRFSSFDQEIYMKHLEQIIISRWYRAIHIQKAPIKSFTDKWSDFINFSDGIPMLSKSSILLNVGTFLQRALALPPSLPREEDSFIRVYTRIPEECDKLFQKRQHLLHKHIDGFCPL